MSKKPEWVYEWTGMPDFEQEKQVPYDKMITIRFRNQQDYEEFAKLIGQPLTERTKSIWYPKLEREPIKQVYGDES